MRRVMLVGMVFAAVCFFGNTLGMSQQSGITNIAGGRGGNEFSDVEPAAGTRVTEIRIRAGDTIDALQMIYAPTSGRGFEGDQHGGNGGRPNIFRLEPDEYIIGLSGRQGDTIDSLRIVTNKRTSPTYGGRGGSRDYRIDVPNGSQAIGFVGRSGDTIDAIGLVYIPIQRRRSGVFGQGGGGQLPEGQFGGTGGAPFADQDVPQGARVAEIRIASGDTIDSLQMIYAQPNGRLLEGNRHGGSGGRPNIFRLDADEYIIGLSGRCGDTIDSLRILTNKRTSPTYGGRGGSRDYRTDALNGSQAIGFVGRSGDTIDAIGLSYIPIPRRQGGFLGQGGGGFGGFGGGGNQNSQTQLFGGRGGTPFVDQDIPQGARVAEIRIAGFDRIDSVQMIYALPNGRTVEGERHGGSGGRERIFRLDRDEYVVGLSGRIGNGVDSLAIETNKRTSQTFGGRGGSRDYRINVPAGNQAIGFAGRAGDAIDAIGLIYARMGINRR